MGLMGEIMVKPHEVLQAGINHMQDRAATYDQPEGERSMAATVKAFNAITGDGSMSSEERGWLFMNVLKMVRSQQGDFKLDNYEDGAAYWGLGAEAAHKERSGVTGVKDLSGDELKKLSDSAVKSYEQKQGWKPGELAGDGGSEVVMITAKGVAMLDGAKKACKGNCKNCKQEWPDEDRPGEHYAELSNPQNWIDGDLLELRGKNEEKGQGVVVELVRALKPEEVAATVIGYDGVVVIHTDNLKFYDRPNPKN